MGIYEYLWVSIMDIKVKTVALKNVEKQDRKGFRSQSVMQGEMKSSCVHIFKVIWLFSLQKSADCANCLYFKIQLLLGL